MDSIHKMGVVVLVIGEVEVGMTRDIHTKLVDDLSLLSVINYVKLFTLSALECPQVKA